MADSITPEELERAARPDGGPCVLVNKRALRRAAATIRALELEVLETQVRLATAEVTVLCLVDAIHEATDA